MIHTISWRITCFFDEPAPINVEACSDLVFMEVAIGRRIHLSRKSLFVRFRIIYTTWKSKPLRLSTLELTHRVLDYFQKGNIIHFSIQSHSEIPVLVSEFLQNRKGIIAKGVFGLISSFQF